MTDLKRISYEEFGHNFIHHIITAQRLRTEIERALQAMIEGTVSKLPADLLVASYVFQMRDAQMTPLTGQKPALGFMVELIGELDLNVRFAGLPLRFTIRVRIRLHADVETYAPVVIRLRFRTVQSQDVLAEVDGHGAPSKVLEHLMIVKPIVISQLAAEVNDRLQSAALTEATTIDLIQIAASAQISTGSLGLGDEAPWVEVHGDGPEVPPQKQEKIEPRLSPPPGSTDPTG